MRQALLLFDYEDSSSDPLKSIMLQCFMHPLYFKFEEV